MSDAAFLSSPPRRPLTTFLAVPVTLLLVSAVLVMKAWNKDFLSLFKDTDDATRLVVVRDLMGGQNWFDHVVHRFNTPFGAEIHWSRLIDLPMSLLIRFFEAFVPGQGEHIVLFVWPLIWLLPALYLVARLSRHLCGPGSVVIALILAALTMPVSTEFTPGRIDHHNVQMVLVLWLTIETLLAPRSNTAALRAGIAAATSLAIGAETMIIVAAAIAAFGLNWVMAPRFAPRLVRFGWAFAAAMFGHFLIAVGPADWLVAKCDATSIVFVVAALAIAAVFMVLVRLPFNDTDWERRLAAGFAGAVLIAALLLELFPACAGGPFADLDPWLKTSWLARVAEVQPLWTGFLHMIAYATGSALPVVIAFGVVLVQLVRRRGETRRDWLIYALVLLAAIIGLVIQMRGARLAALIAVPGGVAMILFLRHLYLARRGPSKPLAALGLVLAWIGSTGLTVFVSMSLLFPEQTEGGLPLADCQSVPAFENLAHLSPARIAAPIDLGPAIALMTAHAVVGAPYHRNAEGIGDSYRIFGGSEALARAILRRRGIDLIVTCDAMLALSGGDLDAPDALARRLETNDLPDWLTLVPGPDTTLKIYRVAR